MGEEIELPPIEVEKPDGEEKRWYHHGGHLVTFEEFRETPLGVDTLRGESGEEALQEIWSKLVTEQEHLVAGDRWALQEMPNNEVPFSLLSTFEKVEWVVHSFVKFAAVFGVLYLFIIALGLMGGAFKILGGRSSGRTFRDSDLISNPVAGLAIGILATVLMQSSSTTTSIVISMAASELVSVENAAYLVMGANIGTSVTNTIVSIAHLSSPDEYRRAFTGAVFHDMFNWLTVGIFLPLEATSGFLMELAGAAVDSLDLSDEKREKTEFIKKITKPAEGRVISVDKKLITKIAQADTSEEVKELEKQSIIKAKHGHAFRMSPISDNEVGVLMLFVSLAMLTTCLLMLVKLLGSVLKGRVAVWTRYLLNIDFKHPVLRSCGGWDNYILLLFGTGVTILVQSSSVFTSTLTPLVGIGLIHIEKMVPLTHGANIGTTVTGVLSALSGDNIDTGLRVALEHVFFNCLGTVVWFVIWPLRPAPLILAKFMGETAANIKWFPLAYIISMFVALPGLVLGLSIAGWEVLLGVGMPLLLIFLFGMVLVFIRRNRADLLPQGSFLRAENAPCGCRYPNFMQLWGGDLDVDRVDISKLMEKERKQTEKENSVTEWHYSAVAWGLSFLSFFCVLISLNSGMWGWVRYDVDPMDRSEVGLGLLQWCSKNYESDESFATPPPACNITNVQECAYEVELSCEEDTTWAEGEITDNEKMQYQNAWEFCSKNVGCRGQDWTEMCTALPACAGRANHEELCRSPLEQDGTWFKIMQAETHGVTFDYSTLSGVTERAAMYLPANDHFATSAADAVSVAKYTNTTLSAISGAAFDGCLGNAYMLSTESCSGTNVVPQFMAVKMVRDVKKTGDATWSVRPQSSIELTADLDLGSCSDVEVAGLRMLGSTGRFVTVDTAGSRIMVFSSAGKLVKSFVPANSTDTEASTGAPVQKILPENFDSISTAAVKPGTYDSMVVCRRRSLASNRLVRCAQLSFVGLNSTEDAEPVATLESVRLVLLTDQQTDSDMYDGKTLEIAGATWLEDNKVLLMERVVDNTTFVGTSLYEVDMNADGISNLKDETTVVESNVDTTTTYTSLALAAEGLVAAPMTLKLTSDDAAVGLAAVDVSAPNPYTVVFSHDVSGDQLVSVVSLTAALFTEDDDLEAAWCSTPAATAGVAWTGEKKSAVSTCHSINDICPEGDLGGDMKVVRALDICGTLFLGLGLFLVITYSLFPYHPVMKNFIFASAVSLTLAWVFCLATWAHFMSLLKNEYGCMFLDENLRGGVVLLRGELQWLARESYSWAFMIVGWSILTFPVIAVWHRVVRLTCLPEKPKFEFEGNEPAAEGAVANEPANDAAA